MSLLCNRLVGIDSMLVKPIVDRVRNIKCNNNDSKNNNNNNNKIMTLYLHQSYILYTVISYFFVG